MWELASNDWFDAGTLTKTVYPNSNILYGGYCPCQVYTWTCGSDKIRCTRDYSREVSYRDGEIWEQYNQDPTVELIRQAIAELIRLGHDQIEDGVTIVSPWASPEPPQRPQRGLVPVQEQASPLLLSSDDRMNEATLACVSLGGIVEDYWCNDPTLDRGAGWDYTCITIITP
jgi:hypothetical protein